mmetsp:Transcript_4428/g.6511  ORF Transcript_4428/g.6511 Transcript_4428/m.6511 type:complete len:142 (+) Transcript_4428:4692-5117(+)
MFKKDTGLLRFLKSIFYFNNQQVQKKLFLERELDVIPTLQPDEIIWENLKYSGDDQRLRKWFMQFISILFLVITTVLTIYIGAVESFVDEKVPEANCPDFYVQKDPYDKDYTILALRDWQAPSDKQDGLMYCYCSRHSSLI